MPRALIIGGTGLIGRATAARLLAASWQVDLTGRDPARLPAHIAAAGGRFIPADRQDATQLAAAFGDGADLLVDCLCYNAAQRPSTCRETCACRHGLPLASFMAASLRLSVAGSVLAVRVALRGVPRIRRTATQMILMLPPAFGAAIAAAAAFGWVLDFPLTPLVIGTEAAIVLTAFLGATALARRWSVTTVG